VNSYEVIEKSVWVSHALNYAPSTRAISRLTRDTDNPSSRAFGRKCRRGGLHDNHIDFLLNQVGNQYGYAFVVTVG
jgi:hypothetical protein